MIKTFLFAAVLIVFNVICAFGQTPQVSPQPLPLETILSEAEKQTANYQETFKNLLADETKTFQDFDKNGELKEQSVVESNFLVYQSAKDKNLSSELRNVTKVDGKLIPGGQEKSDAFFAELQKTSTLEKELEKIQNEGSKYDKTLEISGLTLSEAVVLSENLRPFFDFKLLGSESFQGNDVYVVSYQQTRKSPFISINGKGANSSELSLNLFNFNLPKSLKNADTFLRGKLWIDAKTFQVWREERELTIQGANPIVILETIFEYQPSDYGILVPKQISLLANQIKREKENQYTTVKDTKVDFTYSRFKKSDVEVKILDD